MDEKLIPWHSGHVTIEALQPQKGEEGAEFCEAMATERKELEAIHRFPRMTEKHQLKGQSVGSECAASFTGNSDDNKASLTKGKEPDTGFSGQKIEIYKGTSPSLSHRGTSAEHQRAPDQEEYAFVFKECNLGLEVINYAILKSDREGLRALCDNAIADRFF
ncbi:hypothetical protein U1Q18_029843 [Sarracenia purpurea var. burkii]